MEIIEIIKIDTSLSKQENSDLSWFFYMQAHALIYGSNIRMLYA